MGVWAQQPTHIQRVTLTFSLNILVILSHKLSWSQPSSMKFSPLFWSGINHPEFIIPWVVFLSSVSFPPKTSAHQRGPEDLNYGTRKVKVSGPTLPEGYLVCSRHFLSCLCDCPEEERFCEELSLLQYNRSFYTLTFWHNICMNKRGKSCLLSTTKMICPMWLSVSRCRGQRKAWHKVWSLKNNKAE